MILAKNGKAAAMKTTQRWSVAKLRPATPGASARQARLGQGGSVLATIPNLSVVKSFIDLIGYFGHAVEVPRAWPTPAATDDAATG